MPSTAASLTRSSRSSFGELAAFSAGSRCCPARSCAGTARSSGTPSPRRGRGARSLTTFAVDQDRAGRRIPRARRPCAARSTCRTPTARADHELAVGDLEVDVVDGDGAVAELLRHARRTGSRPLQYSALDDRGSARCTPRRAPSRARRGRQFEQPVSPARACWRAGSTRSDRGRDGSTRRIGREGSTRGDALADLRLLVMAHRNAEARRDRGDTPPLGRATWTTTSLKSQTSIAPASISSRHPVAESSLCPGTVILHLGLEANVPHRRARSLIPAARLLQPIETGALDETDERDRIVHRPRLVRVGAEDEVVADGLARAKETALASVSGIGAAHLELHAREAELTQLCHLVFDVEIAVVPADRDHRHRLAAIAAPEPPQRLADRFAERVPERGVDARARDETQPPVAQDVVGRGPRQLPRPARVRSASVPRRRGAISSPHDRCDRLEALVLVTRPRLPDRSPSRCGRGR